MPAETGPGAGTAADLATDLADLRRRVETTEAVLAVQALKARYAALVDARFAGGRPVDDAALTAAAEGAAALFTEDALWDGGPSLGVVRGRSAIATRLRSPTVTFARHLFLTPLIEVDGERATGRWGLLSPCTRGDGSPVWLCGWEDDTYARVDGVWLHTSMALTTVFAAPAPGGWGRILA